MTESVPRYEEVYVVSDLHLGGSPGAQIFSLGTRLAATIDRLRDAPAEVRRALVINGDFIDFLAEGPAEYFSGSEAIAKLTRIIGDAAFAPVFEALKSFVGTAGRSLVIVLGNHDVELALPEIQQWLTDWLTGLDPKPKVGVAALTFGPTEPPPRLRTAGGFRRIRPSSASRCPSGFPAASRSMPAWFSCACWRV